MRDDIPRLTEDPINPDYKQALSDFLANYEDGWDILKRANETRTWDYPVVKTAEGKTKPNLPDTWLGVVEHVLGIIAREKYGLDCYENQIDVVTANQMIDVYASYGALPVTYDHWSFGKKQVEIKNAFMKNRMPLAYEIVINSDPALAYCMEDNSPVMQILVIAHASFGHNSFFKGNYLFREHTHAQLILPMMDAMSSYLRECEEKYGEDAVTDMIDACHTLRDHSCHWVSRPAVKPLKERAQRALDWYTEHTAEATTPEIYREVYAKEAFRRSTLKDDKVDDNIDDENVLLWLANNAPHLKDWQRNVMRMFADMNQYFHPQGLTKVMNEGWASFWHYQLMHDLLELDLIDDGMILEFYESHTSVLYQSNFTDPWYSGINPYYLGFEVLTDIVRICTKPTDEDKTWFPHIAGNGKPLETIKDAMRNFKDDAFIEQFLSPNLMRKMKLFAFIDDEKNTQHLIVEAIHSDTGYETVRKRLAEDYEMGKDTPDIRVYKFADSKGEDRRLILRHYTGEKRRPIDQQQAYKVLRELHRVWGHQILLESVNEAGTVMSTVAYPLKPEKPKPGNQP